MIQEPRWLEPPSSSVPCPAIGNERVRDAAPRNEARPGELEDLGGSRPRSLLAVAGVGCLWLACLVLAPLPAAAQPIADGAAFLAGAQEADGGWSANQVRRLQATTEALRALQAVGR